MQIQPDLDHVGKNKQKPNTKGISKAQKMPTGKEPYGQYGKKNFECYSLETLMQKMEEQAGQFFDQHTDAEDEVPAEVRQYMVDSIVEGLKARGIGAGDVEGVLNKLRKKRKDHLRELKKQLANYVLGGIKLDSIKRPNRRSIEGVKGKRRVRACINVLLDTSGSMGGDFEKVLNFIFQNDIEINMIQCDTVIHGVQTIKSKKELEKMKIRGFGGTELQPGINYVAESKELNKYNTVVLTDGYCDSLDLSKLKGKTMLISCGVAVPISVPGRYMKQFIIDKEDAK